MFYPATVRYRRDNSLGNAERIAVKVDSVTVSGVCMNSQYRKLLIWHSTPQAAAGAFHPIMYSHSNKELPGLHTEQRSKRKLFPLGQ